VEILTEIAAADAVNERVTAAGREDERLSDRVEDAKYNDVMPRRFDAPRRKHPQFVKTHKTNHVAGRPTDNKHHRDGQNGRRDTLHLPPSSIRRQPYRQPVV